MPLPSGQSPPGAPAPPAWPQIVGMAAALLGALVLIRASLVGFVLGNFLSKRSYVGLAAATAYDGAFVTALAAAFLLLALPRSRRWRRAMVLAFAAVAVLVFLASVANVRAIAVIGQPFSFQWLYYSGYLMGNEARAALLGSFLNGDATLGVGGVLAMLAAGLVAGRLIARAWASLTVESRRAVTASVTILLAGWFAGGHAYVRRFHWPEAKIAPPLYVLARSAVHASELPLLFTAAVPAGDGDVRAAAVPVPPPPGIAPARHVVLFVFESLPARCVGAYGAGYGATPHLDRWAERAALFENAYAHAPASNRSLFSILASAYPLMSYRGETREAPALPLRTLSGELKAAGWATGFFYSSDLQYDRAGEFLRAHDFEHVEDYRDRPGQPFTSEEFPFLDGSDDLETVRSLLDWTSGRGRQPWLAVIWTNGTHYPYFVRGPVGPFPNVTDPAFARYLTALKHGDEAFAALMDELRRRGQLDDTLVVVLGDHGEAFGQHEQLTHAGHVYDENVHVPLLLIGPGLPPRRQATVAGLVDIAPTVVHLAGLPSPAGWQGRSLFAADRSPRTYYFTPYSDFVLGCREGDLSYVFDATRGKDELFDLSTDPDQRHNIASARRAEVRRLRERLAAWVQYQKRMYDGLVGAAAASEARSAAAVAAADRTSPAPVLGPPAGR